MSTVGKAARYPIPLLLAGALTLGLAAPALATPPGIPTAATARSELASLTIAAEGSMAGYSREQFPHWSTVSGACNTRETVLERDGTNVVTDSSCAATSGRWTSPYDGATWSAASDVDIDHVVPLAEAWRSGASAWTTARREQFANDLAGPQLVAVTDNVNQAKGDQDPAAWKPPLTGYWCTYAKMWVRTKYRWGLKVNSTEKTALQSMLGRC
ncbi:HNH endonuclease family protein [Actinosynnema sp. NPDC050436]|uniref:HNH endonuclease family protein n=1 Tax=Actinosynnema sp. NPDC050436 TaxID=3155659 RepID=UPI0033E779C7